MPTTGKPRMTPVYMRYYPTPELPTVLTIHNMAFQGQFSADIFPSLRLPPHAFCDRKHRILRHISAS